MWVAIITRAKSIFKYLGLLPFESKKLYLKIYIEERLVTKFNC